jgi:hypothetical protein
MKNMDECIDHMQRIRTLILKYGIDIAGPSVYRLLNVLKNGELYEGLSWEREIEICERRLKEES